MLNVGDRYFRNLAGSDSFAFDYEDMVFVRRFLESVDSTFVRGTDSMERAWTILADGISKLRIRGRGSIIRFAPPQVWLDLHKAFTIMIGLRATVVMTALCGVPFSQPVGEGNQARVAIRGDKRG